MRKNTGSLLAIVASIALLVLMVYGCSNKNKESAASERQAINEQTASRVANGLEQNPASGNESHWGDKCRMHFYYIAPGQSASVTFETEVDAATAKIANEEEPTVQKKDLEALGYSVSYLGRSVDTFSLNLPVWTVSEPSFALKDNETLWYHPFGGASIDWNRNGEGTITSVPGTMGMFAVGKLTRDELSKKLGGSNTISIRGPKDSIYSLTPTQKEIPKEFHILSVTIDIRAPEENIKGGGVTHGSVLWKGKGVEFRREYDNKNNRYVISGPAKSRDCF
ncbi:MAG: hypothetical protein A4E58_02330 [Syntrophorhabdus sp. PtaB.Bin006]|nr:MAG: hypothetical protein A4E58_02330 [Syntrophorhabdus sp. PtaB.Bin006]